MREIKYKVLNDVSTPQVMTYGDAGLDLKTYNSLVIWPQETIKVPLGVAFDIPKDMHIQITGRSSVALQGIYVFTGIVDSSFNGNEVSAILTNLGDKAVSFVEGERICQAVGFKQRTLSVTTEAIDSRDSKEGYGSSGRF